MTLFGRLAAFGLLASLSLPALAQTAAEKEYKAVGHAAGKPAATIPYGSDPEQVADLRLPEGKGPFPVAVVIHGGCWLASYDDRTGIAGFAEALGKRGFATWNIEYRRVGNAGGGFPGTFQDVSAAIEKLPSIAGRYGLDLSRVIFVGHSAGAHLALWAASRPRLPLPWSNVEVRPVSVVSVDGPPVLAPLVGMDEQSCGQPAIVPLMGGTPAEKGAEFRIASPGEHLPLGVHQLLVGADLKMLLRPYAEAARANGDAVDVLEPDNADHFDIVTPGTPNGDAVLDFIAAKSLARPAGARN